MFEEFFVGVELPPEEGFVEGAAGGEAVSVKLTGAATDHVSASFAAFLEDQFSPEFAADRAEVSDSRKESEASKLSDIRLCASENHA